MPEIEAGTAGMDSSPALTLSLMAGLRAGFAGHMSATVFPSSRLLRSQAIGQPFRRQTESGDAGTGTPCTRTTGALGVRVACKLLRAALVLSLFVSACARGSAPGQASCASLADCVGPSCTGDRDLLVREYCHRGARVWGAPDLVVVDMTDIMLRVYYAPDGNSVVGVRHAFPGREVCFGQPGPVHVDKAWNNLCDRPR